MDPDDLRDSAREKKQEVNEMLVTGAQLRDEGNTDSALEVETQAKLLQDEALREQNEANHKENQERREEIARQNEEDENYGS